MPVTTSCRIRRLPLVFGVALLGSVLVMACAPTAERPPAPDLPSVILISFDTCRADVFGSMTGEEPSLTPRLDEFTADAVVFEKAFAQAPHTLPSHMSLFTSVYPDVHQVKPDLDPLPPTFTTLPQLLDDQGFATVGLFTTEWLKADFGFGRGFDYYRQVPHELTYADRVNARALHRLASLDADRPFFLFLHYYDLHSDFDHGTHRNKWPYYAPGPYRQELGLEVSSDGSEFCDDEGNCNTRYLIAMDRERVELPASTIDTIHGLYRAAVPLLDSQMGEFFDTLKARGLYRDTLIVITSDHGEEFREHGRFIHSQPYDETIQVPLFIKFPHNWQAGTRITDIAETVDIMPTLLDYLDLEIPETTQGVSLMELVEGATGRDKELVASQDTISLARYGLRTDSLKFIMNLKTSRRELYDLATDPGEQTNLVDERTELADRLEERLESLVRHNRALGKALAVPGDGEEGDLLSPEERERLKALGYLN